MNLPRNGQAKTRAKESGPRRAHAGEKGPGQQAEKGERNNGAGGGWNSFQTDLNAYKLSETELVDSDDADQKEG